MKIIDLNDDCLCYILEKLHLSDLFSTAKSNQRLCHIAGLVFAQKYGKHLIKIGKSSVKAYENAEIIVEKLSDIETFFCHFGSFITKLQIILIGSDYMQIEHFIFTNCGESLIEMNLFYGRCDVMKNIEIFFPKLRKLSISGGILNHRISNFNKWFPKLNSLDLCIVDFEDKYCFQSQFMHLHSLQLQYNGNFERLKRVIKPNLTNLIRLNPQIQILRTSFYYLHENFDKDFYRCIGNSLLNLEMFELHDESNLDGDEIEFKKVKKFILKCNWSNPLPIFHFDQLEEFYFVNMPEIDSQFIDFIIGNRFLKVLSLSCAEEDFEIRRNDLIKLSKIENLKEFHLKISIDTLTANNVLDFITNCKSLNKIHLNLTFSNVLNCEFFFQKLIECLVSNWNIIDVTIADNYREAIIQRKNNFE